MQFPLPDTDLSPLTLARFRIDFFNVSLKLVQMMDTVVADADGADSACFLGLEKSAPGAVACSFASIGAMNEISTQTSCQ